jgi:hypothetical protein
MPGEIEPALSREQWRALFHAKYGWVILEDFGLEPVTATFAHDDHGEGEGRGIILRDIEPPATLFNAKGVVGLMALCNAALASDSPYKVTREGVEALCEAVEAWQAQMVDAANSMGEPVTGPPEVKAMWLAGQRILAALAAIIPPDDVVPG